MGRVLLLTASYGDGHNKAAYAVRDELQKLGIETRVEDYLGWLPVPIQRLSQFALRRGIKSTPKLYGAFYHSSSRIKTSSPFQRRVNRLGMPALEQALQEFTPDAVVSTFPLPNSMIADLRHRGITTVPTSCIVTDYAVHPQWVSEQTDLYFVGSHGVEQGLVEYGIPSSRIEVSGIPMRSCFDSDSVLQMLRQRHEERVRTGLNPSGPVVLVMGGGDGILDDVSALGQMTSRIDAQFVFVCGRNQYLYHRLKRFESPRVKVLRYVQDIDRWMAMSDLLITKAGGLTLTEAYAMELPMILLPPIPGQETQNAHFAVQSGAALQAHQTEDVEVLIQSLVRSPEALQTMRRASGLQARRDAASRIAWSVARLAGIPVSNLTSMAQEMAL